LGVILFILVKGNFPFEEAKMDNQLYNRLTENPQNFWKMHKGVSQEVKSLITAMLQKEPSERLSLASICQ